MLETLKREWTAKVALLIFAFFTLFWVSLFFFERDSFWHAVYGSTYTIMAAWGGVVALTIASKWGGRQSVMGRSILAFAFALLAQTFGQVAYSFYIFYLKIELPYPSIGDAGYTATIFFYIYGLIMLAKASGVHLSLSKFKNQLSAALIPLAMLIFSYFVFLRGYEFDWSNILAILSDFGNPLGQAINVSLALLTYLLSRNTLGGIMKTKVLFILFAIFMQYVSDFSFLYLVNKELWFVGGINDYSYLLTYFLLTIALIQLKTVSDKLSST